MRITVKGTLKGMVKIIVKGTLMMRYDEYYN